MFKEQASVEFLVSGVFLHCLATRGTSKTVLFSLFVSPFTAWSHVERAKPCRIPLLSLSLLLSPWSEVSVAQHILISPDVHNFRTEDIFALEELSFNETRLEKTPIFVDALHLLNL